MAIFAAVLLAGGGGAYAASQWLGGNQSSGDGGSGQDSAATADVDHADVDWTSTAEEYDGKADKTVGYECPAQGTIGTVWGSGPYTTDSSVCTAAVHAGKISLESGGRVVIKIRAGENSYQGSTKHDIVTTAYDSYPWAFDIIS